MRNKLSLAFALFLLGLAGVLSMLTVTIPLEGLPKEITERFSPEVINLLVLINPAILLLISIAIGTALYEKVKLSVPTISKLLGIDKEGVSFKEQLQFGIALGTITGIGLILIGLIFQSSLPKEFVALGEKIKLTALARLLYGGFTEEILMRFGFMTLVTWILSLFMKELSSKLYWTGILLASLLFAVGHFPVVYQAVAQPSAALLLYILLGNASAGISFGWLYWKKGLEAAFIAHIFAHITMMMGEQIFQLS